MTLEEALSNFLQANRSTKTNDMYSRVLTRFAKAVGPERPLALIRTEDIDAFIKQMRSRSQTYSTHPTRPTLDKPLATTTVYKNVKIIKTFFNWCERMYEVPSPARWVINRRPQRPLGQGKAATDHEVEMLLAASRFKPRDRAMVLTLVHSGCRATELAELCIRNLDLEEHSALIVGKGDKQRKIYFNEETSDAIRSWLEKRPQVDHDYVFLSLRTKRQLDGASVSQMLRRLCRLTGIRSLGAHSLRHRVGLKFARARIAPRVAQAYLGHSNVTITLSYYQDVDESDLRLAGEIL